MHTLVFIKQIDAQKLVKKTLVLITIDSQQSMVRMIAIATGELCEERHGKCARGKENKNKR